jgi:hypothetical protein
VTVMGVDSFQVPALTVQRRLVMSLGEKALSNSVWGENDFDNEQVNPMWKELGSFSSMC